MNSYQCFEKYKNIIFKEIIREFGINNQEYIKNLFNDFKIVLEVTPKEELIYFKDHINKDNLLETLQKYYECLQFEYHKKKIFNKYIKEILDKWISYFIDLNSQKNYDKIAKLFYDYDTQEYLIDYFKSDVDLSNNQKEIVIFQRKRFMSIIKDNNYKIKSLDSKIVDLFIKWRDLYVKDAFMQYLILENDQYILRMISIINDSNPSIIKELINLKNPTCFKYKKNDGTSYRFVYLPINRLKRNGNHTIDVILIHEMIHYLQDYWGDEVILNEVLVQNKAIKIAERLHKKGIFIFDYEDKAKGYGECIYEILNPFVNKIIQYIPNDLLNELIITENYQLLVELFGEKFNNYIILLGNLYQDYVKNNSFKFENLQVYEECIKEMISYFDKQKNKVKYLKKSIE